MTKQLLFLGYFLLVSTTIFADTGDFTSTTSVVQKGVGLGSVIAVVTSWERNKSILWAILHGIFSWFYVIYFALTRNSSETK
ncbi:MAG: hypothetical protein ACTHXJ_01870 [Mesonia sp.]